MPSGTLSFQVIATIDCKTARVPSVKFKQRTKTYAARKRCREILNQIDAEGNPVLEKRQKRTEAAQRVVEGFTPQEALANYLAEKRTGKQNLPLKLGKQGVIPKVHQAPPG